MLSLFHRLAAAASLVLVLAAAVPAHAAILDLDGWIATVNLRGRYKPPFEGSADHTLIPIGSIALRRSTDPARFTPPDRAGGLGLIGNDRIQIGPSLDLGPHRGDDARYAGLDRVPMTLEPGVFVEAWPTDWLRGFVGVRRGVRDRDGWQADAAADLVHSGDRISTSLGPRVGFGDRNYMQTYFGVSPVEAARSPLFRQAYRPAAGVRYMGVAAAVGYRVNTHLRTTLDVLYSRLGAAGADSPVVRRSGAVDQVAVGLGFSYVMGRLR